MKIRQYRKRILSWTLEEFNIKREKWLHLSYEKLIKLGDKLGLRPTGGSIRFPGSKVQEHSFGFQVIKESENLVIGENFRGHGKTLEDAIRSALTVVVELKTLRKKQGDLTI